MISVIIGIGFDGANDPDGFYDAVIGVVNRLGVLEARIIGDSYSADWGDERGAWIAASFSTFERFTEARERILAIGGSENQDAIAFTIGYTDIAPCPKTAPKPLYRDFL